VGEAVWAQQARPLPGSAANKVGCWEPASVADVTAHRRELAGALRRACPSGADEDAVDRLLLVFEELASNALRHGTWPIRVEVTFDHDCWLLDVTDAAVDRPPIPAVGRDAAEGGLGLYLVARLCPAHGWTVAGARKHVWARIDFARADASKAGPELVPQPRGETAAATSADPARG
jgi:anti-sigma regulatory factor (Ser/Thr protein kinase)